MKNRTLFAIVCMLVLAACSSVTSTSYTLSFRNVSEERFEELAQQAGNVAQRRLETMGTMGSAVVDVSAGEVPVYTLTVTADNAGALTALTEQLQQPFTLDIMGQTQEGEAADITVEGQGSFTKTGITQTDLAWVVGGKDPQANAGQVQMFFTEEGLTKMQALFQKMIGQNIGLFVRGQLVSKLFVASEEIQNDITISGVPSVDLAVVFAEDVNVGSHVTFTPVAP